MSEEKSYSIVNFGDLAKPADTLIKKVSDAVGGIFQPFQIKRIAKAEAEAALIRTEGEIQVTDFIDVQCTAFSKKRLRSKVI
jgi:hypothetical protein